MARSWFGGTHLDVVIRPYRFGNRQLADLAAGAKVTFWDAAEGGSQVTDLLDANGSPVSSISADGDGWLPEFQAPPPGEEVVNYQPDPFFSESDAGYSSFPNGTSELDATRAKFGDQSLKVTTTADGTNNAHNGTLIADTAGMDRIYARAWAYADPGNDDYGNVNDRPLIRIGGSGVVAASSSRVEATGEWVAIDLDVPTDGDGGTVVLYLYGGNSAGDVVWFDGVYLSDQPIPAEGVFAGDSQPTAQYDYAWDGTPHDSPSRRTAVTRTLWADAGFGRRFLMVTTDHAIDLSSQLSTRIPTSEKGKPNGVATLDGSGRVTESVDAGKLFGTLLVDRLPSIPNSKIGTVDATKVTDPPWMRSAVSATVRYVTGTTVNSGDYTGEVTRVHTDGWVPGLAQKRYADDYDQDGTSGANFTPPREDLDAFYDREGFDIVVDVDALSAGDGTEIVGAQVKDGVIYHDFAVSTEKIGTDALGFRADGTVKIYSSRFGDTAASMVTDGVTDCFSFGPALVIDGVEEDLEANAQWDNFNTEDSARTILGTSQTGDLIIITIHGESGVYGIRGNDIPAVAAEHGCHQAVMLDGGGSTQLLINGEYAHNSSDATLRRPQPGVLCVRARVTQQLDTGWIDLPLAAGITSGAFPAPAIRRRGSRISLRGRAVKSDSSDFPAAFTTIATLPPEFVPIVGVAGAGTGNSTALQVTLAPAAPDQLQVRPVAAASYADISGVDYTQL